MLLVLADRIRDELPRVLATTDLRDALSNLALAHREGKHVVTGSIPVLNALARAEALSAETRGTFREIKQRHLEARSVRDAVTHVAEIEPREGDIHEEEAGGRHVYRVPLSYFGDSARVQASRLVAEDQDDARVYLCAAAGYLSRLAPKGVTIRFQDYGGSGQNTADAVRDHARQGPTVCVVDADYRWSAEEAAPALGRTAAQAHAVAEDLAGKAICAVYDVPGREIENLLPSRLVLDCLKATDAREFRERCARAADLGLLGGGPPVDRLDLKEGLRRKSFEALPKDSPERRYLARIFSEHRDRVPAPAGGWCGDTVRCGPKKDDPCACVLFDGVGHHLLSHVAGLLDELTPQKVAEYLLGAGQPHEPVWTEIGRLLFSWGCSYPRRRT